MQTATIKLRNNKARDISFAITCEDALQQYGPFYGFPFSALIDKKGRVRFVDQVVDYDEGDATDLLIKRLIGEKDRPLRIQWGTARKQHARQPLLSTKRICELHREAVLHKLHWIGCGQ